MSSKPRGTSRTRRPLFSPEEHAVHVRRAADTIGVLLARRGNMTLAQLRQVAGILAQHADDLYRHADKIERGDAPAKVLKRHSLSTLAAQIQRVGHDDPVTLDLVWNLEQMSEVFQRRPPNIVRPIRYFARRLMELHAHVSKSVRYPPLPRRRGPERRGRPPNTVIDRLLRLAAQWRISDTEFARELARQGIQPFGPGSSAEPTERWLHIITAARARRRRRTK